MEIKSLDIQSATEFVKKYHYSKIMPRLKNNQLEFFEDAIISYNKAIELDPYDFESWVNLADLYYMEKQLIKALQTLEEGLGYNHDSAIILCRMSVYYFLLSNFDLGKEIDGVYQVPNKHFDSGWADYRPASPFHAIHLWARTLDPQDQERVERTRGSSDWKAVTIAEKPFSVKHYNTNTLPWYEFINGNLPTYPMDLLTANHRLIDQQLDRLRSKHGDPRNWPEVDQIMDYPDSLSMKIDGYAIHAWQEFNPVYFESLIQLMLGAPAHISHGGLQHSTVRYYDSDLKRSGVPEDVGALVHTITPEEVRVDLSNVGAKNRKMVIQAGAFLEHSFTRVEITGSNGATLIDQKINGPWIEIELSANTTVQVKLGMTRYCNTPSYENPWSKRSAWDPIIKPRQLGD
jgi:tetratricopeptide (TPR) repeat protein